MIINLNTGATSRSSAAFNSVARAADGNTYALTTTGLVRLDDAAPTDASITFGVQDFGTPALKLLPTAYLGISADNLVSMDVRANNDTYIYFIRDYAPALQQQRFDFGKGLKANWFGLKLSNTQGGDFTLADMTLMPQASNRRI